MGSTGSAGVPEVVLRDQGLGLRVAQALHHGDGYRLQGAGARRVPDLLPGEDFVGVVAERAHREGDHDTVGCDVAAELRGAHGRKARRRPGTGHERVGVKGGRDRGCGHRREREGGVGAIRRWGERCVARPVRRRKGYCLASVCPGTHEFCAGWRRGTSSRGHGQNGKGGGSRVDGRRGLKGRS